MRLLDVQERRAAIDAAMCLLVPSSQRLLVLSRAKHLEIELEEIAGLEVESSRELGLDPREVFIRVRLSKQEQLSEMTFTAKAEQADRFRTHVLQLRDALAAESPDSPLGRGRAYGLFSGEQYTVKVAALKNGLQLVGELSTLIEWKDIENATLYQDKVAGESIVFNIRQEEGVVGQLLGVEVTEFGRGGKSPWTAFLAARGIGPLDQRERGHSER